MSQRQNNRYLHNWINSTEPNENTSNTQNTLNNTYHSAGEQAKKIEPNKKNLSLNRSFSERNRPTRFIVEDDNRQNQFGSGISRNQSPLHSDDSRLFRSEIDDRKVTAEYKTMVNEMHTEYQEKEENLRVENHALSNECKELKADIERVTGEYELTKTKLNQKDEELRNKISENECLIMYEEKSSSLRLSSERTLKQVQTKNYDLELALKRQEVENQRLTTEKNRLLVESTTLQSTNEDLTYRVQTLEKSLEIYDTGLATKLKKYDEKFDNISEREKQLDDYGSKLAKLYEEIELNTKDQRDEIERSEVKVRSLEERVGKLQETVEYLGDYVKDISTNLKQLNSMVGEELLNEIKVTQEKREYLNKESDALSNAHQGMKDKVMSNLVSFRADLDKLQIMNDQKLLVLLPYAIALAVICIFIGMYLRF